MGNNLRDRVQNNAVARQGNTGQGGGIPGSKAQPVDAGAHRCPHVAQATGQHRRAHHVGFRRDQGKTFVTEAGGHHRPAFGHMAVQFRRGQLPQKPHPGPGVLPRR